MIPSTEGSGQKATELLTFNTRTITGWETSSPARQCEWKFGRASGKQAWASGILYRLYKRLPSSGECQKILVSQPAINNTVVSCCGTVVNWSTKRILIQRKKTPAPYWQTILDGVIISTTSLTSKKRLGNGTAGTNSKHRHGKISSVHWDWVHTNMQMAILHDIHAMTCHAFILGRELAWLDLIHRCVNISFNLLDYD